MSSLFDTDLYTEVSRVLSNEDIATELGISYRDTKGLEITVECEDDRLDTQDELEMHLENMIEDIRISRVTKSKDSVDQTVVTGYGKTLRIRYKPRSGGMAETTLNSTITELFPAIAWEKSIPSNLSVTDFAHQVHEASVRVGPTSPYKNNVAKLAGDRFKNIASTSSKFEEKTSAAIGIYKWILNEAKRRNIRGIVWGYRDNTKPAGVNTNHKGDIFILWSGRQKPRITGVSIKAGAVGAKPPQFNSYVRAIFNSNAFGKLADYNKLQRMSYDEIYTNIPNIPAYAQYGKASMTQVIGQFERANSAVYERLYDAQLEWMRQTLVDLINNNPEKAKRWLLEEVAKDQPDVPLVVIQSSGSSLSDVHEVTDEDTIKNCVSVSRDGNGIHARVGTGKQNWHIDLTCNQKTTTLNFTIRTNKAGVGHKLGQYINLAVKFNGITE
jgi:hypothetical protein